MGYFPFFADLSGKEGLIVGGGTVALRKVKKLLPYGPHLTVCAPRLLPALEQYPELTLLRQAFTPQLLEDKFFVLAATDDRKLNREISLLCQKKRIPVNVADDKEYCTFLFPALVHQGPLSIGISTGGTSPSGAVYLKEQIAALIPEEFGAILEALAALRQPIQAKIADGKIREALFTCLFMESLQMGRPLTAQEVERIERDFFMEQEGAS